MFFFFLQRLLKFLVLLFFFPFPSFTSSSSASLCSSFVLGSFANLPFRSFFLYLHDPPFIFIFFLSTPLSLPILFLLLFYHLPLILLFCCFSSTSFCFFFFLFHLVPPHVFLPLLTFSKKLFVNKSNYFKVKEPELLAIVFSLVSWTTWTRVSWAAWRRWCACAAFSSWSQTSSPPSARPAAISASGPPPS